MTRSVSLTIHIHFLHAAHSCTEGVALACCIPRLLELSVSLHPWNCFSSGGYALTYVDSMDTLAVMGYTEEFRQAVDWVAANLHFDINQNVSVFETNIRVLGGQLVLQANCTCALTS